MKISAFKKNTYLAPGVYQLTWSEIVEFLGWNQRRKALLEGGEIINDEGKTIKVLGLKEGLLALKNCGCKKAYLDGSFVSQKDRPGDFDVCYEVVALDFWDKLKKNYEVLTKFKNKRKLQKDTYGGEFHPANRDADEINQIDFLTFFQFIKDDVYPYTQKKGIIEINLSVL